MQTETTMEIQDLDPILDIRLVIMLCIAHSCAAYECFKYWLPVSTVMTRQLCSVRKLPNRKQRIWIVITRISDA